MIDSENPITSTKFFTMLTLLWESFERNSFILDICCGLLRFSVFSETKHFFSSYIELGPGLQSGLRIAEGTSKILTPDMISVTDPDSTNADLVITLVPANGNTVMPGHIENERFSGQARNSFTLEDLSNGRVSFVHQVSSI